jgi:DNA-binding NtrC family response regulator
VATSEIINATDLGLAAAPARNDARKPTPFEGTARPASLRALSPESAAERASIEEALIRAGGVVAKAAAEMGLSRQALYRRMERLDIVLERRPR